MKRERPLISINKIAYLVDVDKEQFTQAGNSDHSICFCALQPTEHGYSLMLNTKTNKVWFGQEGEASSDVAIFHLPPMARLDPVGLAEKYHKPISSFMHLKSDKTWLSEDGISSKLKI